MKRLFSIYILTSKSKNRILLRRLTVEAYDKKQARKMGLRYAKNPANVAYSLKNPQIAVFGEREY